jgi:hypothetical protein
VEGHNARILERPGLWLISKLSPQSDWVRDMRRTRDRPYYLIAMAWTRSAMAFNGGSSRQNVQGSFAGMNLRNRASARRLTGREKARSSARSQASPRPAFQRRLKFSDRRVAQGSIGTPICCAPVMTRAPFICNHRPTLTRLRRLGVSHDHAGKWPINHQVRAGLIEKGPATLCLSYFCCCA